MIYDLLDTFRGVYQKIGDKLILDKYKLKEGLYIKVLSNGEFDTFIVKGEELKDLNGNLNDRASEWFKERDYYSYYLNSNKAFYDKKIHNINYLSFFVKIESFISNLENKLLKREAIKFQYLYLCNYKKFKKTQEREVLKNYQKIFKDRNRKRDIIRKYRWVRDNILKVVNIAKENGVKNYIKIFFDEEIEKYKRESEIYYSIKIFNDIKYSKKVEDRIYGLSDFNMGLNSKKPFLEHKSRKVTIPFIVAKEDIILIKKFFDWLKVQDLKKLFPLDPMDKNFFINRDFKEKDLIIDFDFIPINGDELKKPLEVKNYLLAKTKEGYIEDYKIEKISHLEGVVDEIFYNKQLKSNYFGEVYKKLSNSFGNLIYLTRDAMVDFFIKRDERAFFKIIKRYADSFIIEHIKKSRFLKAKESLNLKFSLLKYRGEEIMNIYQMQKRIVDRLLKRDYKPLTKEEFFYLSGQIIKYLLNQSEKDEKKGDMLEPFLRANSIQKLKKDIEITYFKYKHKISLNNLKFNNGMTLIMSYEGEDKLSNNMDSFLIGLLSDNIFYWKIED